MYCATNFYRCRTKVRKRKPIKEEIGGMNGNYTGVESPRRGRAADLIGTGKAVQTSEIEKGGLFRAGGREVDDERGLLAGLSTAAVNEQEENGCCSGKMRKTAKTQEWLRKSGWAE
jgi:hypothetical protein